MIASPVDHQRFELAPTFDEYLEGVEENADLWRAVYHRVRITEALLKRGRAIPGVRRLAALSEDWCGDAANTLPVVARLAQALGWDLRVFGRDANPDLMDAHLTGGTSRAIPVVIVYDEDWNELGWWGPRPHEPQEWVLREGLLIPSAERYKILRRWYARDGGVSTVTELLEVAERG